jgi:hypothetical protein
MPNGGMYAPPAHNNPVKRDLVKHPGDWPWSRRGGGFYLWDDASILGMDKML